MKAGDIFSRMDSETRMRKVAIKQYHFQEVYHNPDELIADLVLLIGKLDAAKDDRDQMALDVRRLLGAKDDIINDITEAFKRFDHIFKISLPTSLAILNTK